MRKRIEKLCSTRNIMFFLIVVYLLSLIPLCIISKYNYPSADDYSNGTVTYHLWNETHSVIKVLENVMARMIKEYDGWRGCYTSSYLSALTPCAFGQEWTFLTPIITLVLITFAVLFFMDQLVGTALKADRRIGVALSSIILFACVQCLPPTARCELIYWYSGACNYAYIHAFALIYFGLLIAAANHRGKRRIIDIVLAGIMAPVAAGGNQMSSLNGAIIVVTAMVMITWKKKWKQYQLLWIPFLFYLAGFALSMLSPGDLERMQYTDTMNPVKAILISLYYTFSYAVNKWTTWSVILLELMTVPFFWTMGKSIRFKVRYPLLVIAFGYGVVSAMMTPPLFAVSNIDAGRIQGLTFWMYILVLTLCVGYTVVWTYQKLHGVTGSNEIANRNELSRDCLGFWFACLVFFVWGAGLTALPDDHYFTMTSAITDLRNGTSAGFAEEMQTRVELYETSENGVVEVLELENQPELLFFSDIKPDSSDWENNAVAKYFDLKEVNWKARAD